MNFYALHWEDKHTQEKEKPPNFEKIHRDRSQEDIIDATQGIDWLIHSKLLNTLDEQNKCTNQTYKNL